VNENGVFGIAQDSRGCGPIGSRSPLSPTIAEKYMGGLLVIYGSTYSPDVIAISNQGVLSFAFLSNFVSIRSFSLMVKSILLSF